MLEQYNKNKIILIILDGWGYSTKYHGNAIKQADTPILDLLWQNFPSTLLNASGNHVGLPMQQMGNSEVGHTTIGAGRAINQSLVQISQSIDTGTFFSDRTIHKAYQSASKLKGKIHLIGLCSDGGVHSHIKHLIALIKIGQSYRNVRICIHVITDGRDTKPQSAKRFIDNIIREIEDFPHIQICTLSGRYYSMDRDCRWQRTMKAYECLTSDDSCQEYTGRPIAAIKSYYSQGIYDEFIVPTRINIGAIETNDSVICFNFRPDRMRQLIQALSSNSFEGFTRARIQNIYIITFTTYDNSLDIPVVFNKAANRNFLGQVIAEKGLKQFRIAETEKYAHVTYFFNGGQEAPFPGEYRELISSPRVETYDLTPEMAASKITERLIKAAKKSEYQLLVANYSNPDMVGHTGKLKETKKAIEIVDKSIGELISNMISDQEIAIMITADHGNAEFMLDQDNKPCKSHTKNLVPLIVFNTVYRPEFAEKKKKIWLHSEGSLVDIAPTILDILKIKQPDEMNGKSLIQQECYDNSRNAIISRNFVSIRSKA